MAIKERVQGVSRREMIHGLVALFGVGSAVSCSSEKQRVVEGVSNHFGNAFGDSERVFFERIADIILPDTDTPGAIAAGVTGKIETVLMEWMELDERKTWLAELADIYSALNKQIGGEFLEITSTKQLNALRTFDAEAFERQKNDNSGLRSFRKLKEEIATAYYLSEIGATEELRYEQFPGEWKSCVPFTEIGRTWAL